MPHSFESRRYQNRTSHGIRVAPAFSCRHRMAKRKSAAKRELIDTGKHKRFVRRGASGQFKESDDVGRSLKRERQQKAKRKVKSGQEIGGTR